MTLLLGAFGTTAGAWTNVLSVSPDRFYVALMGQTLSATAQVFLLGVSPNVAAVWFGPEEVSSACSIGVFGAQVLSPYLIRKGKSSSTFFIDNNHCMIAWNRSRISNSSYYGQRS